MSGLNADFYELTMAQGFFIKGKNPEVVFEMFFRRSPFASGYAIFAGLHDLLKNIVDFRFSAADLAYLQSTGLFRKDFITFLADFSFKGTIRAFDEGSIVFAGQPLISVRASLIEAQIIESMLLNIINFQTLIATKAARLYLASNRGALMEFGLRRAQGFDGALSAARAAYIGGAAATSNTLAGKTFGIPVVGTMSHAWVMAFDDELSSFRAYSDIYPAGSTLLIDTYDTLRGGIENAIKVGLELKKKGHSIAVRLDSGDLQYLSEQVRQKLNDAGLPDARIVVSNELNEHIVSQLVAGGAPIDIWGVGTELVTGGGDSALSGVYKMVARSDDGKFKPTIKISDNPEKIINPGEKQCYRFFNADKMLADLITLRDETVSENESHHLYHPVIRHQHSDINAGDYDRLEPVLRDKMVNGNIVTESSPLSDIRQFAIDSLNRLDPYMTRLINPHTYKVSLSQKLRDLKFSMIDRQADAASSEER